MARWTWGMLLSLLMFAGCGQQPKPESSQSVSDNKPQVAKENAGESGGHGPVIQSAKPLPQSLRANAKEPGADATKSTANAGEEATLDRFDVRTIEDRPPDALPEALDVDPTLQPLGLLGTSAGSNYGSWAGTPAGDNGQAGEPGQPSRQQADRTINPAPAETDPFGDGSGNAARSGESLAFGRGPSVTGAQGVGTGQNLGSGGSGTGFGERGSGNRNTMLAAAGGTLRSERAANTTLVWLARHQDSDGHWSLQNFTQQCKPGDKTCTGPGEISADTCATAISILPFLAAGQTHKSRGAYQDHVRKGVQWLIHQQQPDGNLAKGAAQTMYSHGLATIALSEAYGLTGDRQVGMAAQAAVDFILKAQSADGGWHDNPKDPAETSVVGWQLMALKSARMAGLEVGEAAFTSAGKWLDSVAVHDGVEYAGQPGRSPSPMMTSVGLLSRQYLGAHRDNPMIRGGVEYLLKHLPDEDSPNVYYWYTATQFMHNNYGAEWDTWNRKMRDVLVHSQVRNADQCANGSWAPEKDAWGSHGGRVVQTALCALTLETYYRYLPLFKTDADRALGHGAESVEQAAPTLPTPRSPLPAPRQEKSAETWKPARLVPNTSRLMVGDKEELPLKGMQVDVRIDGFRARVVLDLYYFNDRAQQLEGNFQLRLPDEASPCFFAFGKTVYQARQITTQDSMFYKSEQVSQGDTTPEKILALRGDSWEQPKVARMVAKEKAAFAYRETVRRRVDPALVEWSGAGVFQCRVFPLAPQSLHRVVIGYDVDLLHTGDDLELRLDLAEHTPATIVDFNIAASDAKDVSLDAPATKSADGQRLAYRVIDPQERPLIVRLRKPGTTLLSGSDGATGNYFAARVGLSLPASVAQSANGSKEAVFLVDTSLSAGPQFALWTKLLRATLENNRDRIERFAVLFFNVETFWWQEHFVPNTAENVESLMQYADGLALEGATDLGRALKEAASPAWLEKRRADPGAPPHDLFLLSDGAATWGEDRWPLMAATLKNAQSGPLFAYPTGMAGGDPRCLAYLAEQTAGAVFSVVAEAEIAGASVAHRKRPWQLTGVEVTGGRDVLIAGRPKYVFPGQQLLVVGRLEGSGQWTVDGGQKTPAGPPAPSPQSPAPLLTFTLQQGTATQTIRTKMDHVLASELAARAYGQVATAQLEDSSTAAEPVATVYARHFRITGRTCSLLMLESEQDYARYNIKPEEDDFVVKDRPAAAIVKELESRETVSDAKTLFMDWYRKLGGNEQVRFDLPASLGIALEGLPAEAFEIAAPALHCKLRMQKDLPEDFRRPWQTGVPDYETLAAEAERRVQTAGADDALRALSSLVEERPGDAALARDVAFASIAWGRPGEAYHLLRRTAAARTFEPVTFHALAHCLEQLGNTEMAIVYYELACAGRWDARFGDVHDIARLDYLRFLRRLQRTGALAQRVGATGRLAGGGRLADYAQARRATLAAAGLRDTADLAVLILWNTDGTDVDLHVIEPSGEECFYQHTQTVSGGRISRDVTTGYGPEFYFLPQAPAGVYNVSAHYFAADANRASTRTKVLALVYQGWGAKDERLTVKAVALVGRSESHELASLHVGKE